MDPPSAGPILTENIIKGPLFCDTFSSVTAILLAVITVLLYRYKNSRPIASGKSRKDSNDHGKDTTGDEETSDVDDNADTDDHKAEETTATIPFVAKVRM